MRLEDIGTGILTFIIIALLMFGFFYALNENEIVECKKLERYSIEHRPHFFLTEIEKEMCDRNGIEINAPIRNYEI